MTILNMKLILTLSSGLLFGLSLTALAEPTPSLAVYGYSGEPREVHSMGDPLFVSVSIANQAAIMTTRDNRYNEKKLNAFRNTKAYKKLSEEERQSIHDQHETLEIPHFTLGSTKTSLLSLIKFTVFNELGKPVNLDIQAFASNHSKAKAIELSPENPQFFNFAVSAKSLNALLEGDYQLVAMLDTKKQPNMWQGRIESSALFVSLHRQHPNAKWAESGERAQMQGDYLLETNQYEEAETHARETIKSHPTTISGWTQLGEALDGQAKSKQALKAFNTALSQFLEKHGDSPPERPLGIINRINEIESKL